MTPGSLLKSLNLEQKIAQLCAVNSNSLITDRSLDREKAASAFANGIGAVCGAGSSGGIIVGGGTAGGDFTGEEVVVIHNAIQQHLLAQCPHRIPAIIVEECLSGYQQRDATVYPQSLAMAATWQPELMREVTDQIRSLLRAAGVTQALSPVLDLVCDPRWGRNEETYGEDPVLAAAMATAFVKGLQGKDLQSGVAATLKHFLGYGLTEAGRNLASMRAGERHVRDIHLKPFEAALRAGAASVMSAYSDLDGEVITTSRYWLTEVLKEELGFGGTIVCDFGAIEMLTLIFRTADSPKEAVRQAFEAGVDMDFPSGGNYAGYLGKLVQEGRVEEKAIDASVLRVLELKAKLGLLEAGKRSWLAGARMEDFNNPGQQQTAYKAALAGITLLKRQVLPLSEKLSKLAVLGPNADAGEALLGDYSYTGGRRGFWWPRMTRPDALDEVKAISVLESLQQACPKDTTIVHHPGCSLAGQEADNASIEQAAAIASRAEVALIVAGERSTSLSGECRDRHEITLPGKQADLIRAVAQTGVPVCLLVLAGRPLDLSEVEPYCSDILISFYPGDEGGRALADIAFGKTSPGGRLPVSLPADLGLCPADSRMTLNTGWEKLVGGLRAKPLYPFGHGLTYSDFAYEHLNIMQEPTGEDPLRLSFQVTNTGEREADEVAQVYVGDLVASMVQPEFALKAFRKVRLAPGESRSLTLTLPPCALSFTNRNRERLAEAGRFEIRIGRSYADIRLRDFFSLRESVQVTSYYDRETSLE
jgi:beta-glucosidase